MAPREAGRELTAGLVGYGSAGRTFHAPLLLRAGCRVTDVVTTDPTRSAEATSDWPGVRIHRDLAGLLGSARPDVLVVASPTGRHVEHAVAALEAGIPVVVDKPLALDLEGAVTVARRAEATGTPLTVFHNRRWDPEQLTLRRLLAEGALGTVHRFERRWERWRPVPKNRWRENAVGEGGGLLLDLGPHLVDAAMQLFGPVTGVRAELRALTTPTEDDVFLALEHAGGTISHLWAGSLVGAPGPRTRVLGSAGALLVPGHDDAPGPFDALDPGEGMAGWLVRGPEATPVPTAPGEHADFYRAVARWLLEGGDVPVDPWDAVATAAVLDAARRSAHTGALEIPQQL
ncbi:Gfo/Idh/MocA family oxidoreductase [Kocuria sp.]|uniref:Gfo/Idh/MocA family protein n=1 Tax=Kocuria sp. TaxID=1871328 RepID=UPI002810DDD9|nr:Gfo/Idh/MocA family oxidoreductase [Kocuria sp.]